jgi:UDP-2-acetamido-3-amino-2,3-dideoxy-glucuronate N-acetyltransferase
MNLIKKISIETKKDKRGELFFLNLKKKINFNIKRVYYIFNNNSKKSRGFHAHKNVKQMMICLKGSCQIILDNGNDKKKVLLKQKSRGLLILNKIWHEIHYLKKNSILLVLASDIYKESDYIRDYEVFLKKYKK